MWPRDRWHGRDCTLLDWLDGLVSKAQIKCLAKLRRLEELGHELRRPEADYLRDGVYELRVGLEGVNYRILYFFHGKEAVVILARNHERACRSAERD